MTRRVPRLSRTTPSGLYVTASRVQLSEVPQRAAALGWRGAALAGAQIADRAALFDACAAALRLPAYFGRNLDALADCLMDEQWLQADGLLLLYDAPQRLIAADPALWAGLLGVLTDAAQFWSEQQRQCVIVFRPPAGLDYPRIRLS